MKWTFDDTGYGAEYLSAEARAAGRTLAHPDEDDAWAWTELGPQEEATAATPARRGGLPRCHREMHKKLARNFDGTPSVVPHDSNSRGKFFLAAFARPRSR